MAENNACSLEAHRAKVEAEKKNIKYTDEVAEYLAGLNHTKPRPTINQGEIDEKGFWVRQKNSLITPFGKEAGDLKADKDRYIIYWNPGCNWSQRPVIVRELLGLQGSMARIIAQYYSDIIKVFNTVKKEEPKPLTDAEIIDRV